MAVLVVVVVVVSGSEERLKIGYKEETDLVLLFNVGEFKFAIVGIWYRTCCGGCSKQ